MEIAQLILSKGIHGLLKTHLKSNNKLTAFNRNKLERELKYARVVTNESIPENVVAINRNVSLVDIETGEDIAFDLVAPADAKMKNNKVSVLSPVGVAIVGYREGDAVQWDMPEGFKTYRIEKVQLTP